MNAPQGISVTEHVGQFDLILETGKLAKQANGSVVARYGKTTVLAAVVRSDPRPNIDFFPLVVEYRENKFSAGKIPGGFFKREGKPRRKETLTCRLIDRPIRPLFPEGYFDEVQLSVFVYSGDEENDPDVVGMNAASAALTISNIPFFGPIGAVRVGRINGAFIVNPSEADRAKSDLDLVVAATEESIVMVESNAQELTEDVMVDALEFAHEQIKPLVKMQKALAEQVGTKKMVFEKADNSQTVKAVDDLIGAELAQAVATPEKQARYAGIDAAKAKAVEALVTNGTFADDEARKQKETAVKKALEEVLTAKVRGLIKSGKRIDGRGLTDIRPIWGEVGVMPGTHGSAIFTRGETQALVVVTLGSLDDSQPIKGLHPEREERFYLHYDFLPFSVGEVRMYRTTSRREIGHGMLAQRSLEPVIPSDEEFPYTMRINSQILESNGSSSMASVCGGTLAMMDCGVKIKRPVAGIAMGLLKEGDDCFVISDILGDEDHFGDMDFKVAGTQTGITALQMDIKVRGIKRQVIADALSQAREGRIHILRCMLEIIEQPKADYAPHVPRIVRIKIDPSRIGAIIGPGGKNIRAIEAETQCGLDISDDGVVHISGKNKEGFEKAAQRVRLIVSGPSVGEIYEGTVKTVREFGAFIEIAPGIDGLCHISDLDKEYVKRVEDIVNVGDKVKVKVTDVERDGKIRLSRKVLL